MKKGSLLLVLLSCLVVMGLPGVGFSAVAIGYDYAIAPGDPNFAAFILPEGIGDNLYDLYLFNGTEYYFKAHVTGGIPGYIFDPGGVDRFRILGIEASAGIDPNDPAAFGTLLAWVEECDCTEIEHAIIQTVFSDLPIGYWADDSIMAIYDAGITLGCSQNPLMYCPESKVTREQMAAFIIRAMEGDPAGVCIAPPFTDVPVDSPFCMHIQRAVALGITQGIGVGLFGPSQNVTREQMAAFLTRALDIVPADGYCRVTDPFTDVACDRWSCKYIKRLYESRITVGIGVGRFGPDDYVTRAQMAVFLTRALTFLEKWSECSATGYCGPEGGELMVTDPVSYVYGVRIVIPPGALDSVRSLTIEEAYGVAPSLPAGFIAYPNGLNSRAVFQLDTAGDKPYDLGLEFYLPVQGMTIGPGEIACAFAYDGRTGKWRIVLPGTIDGTTMTFKTTYREMWMWGKIVIDQVTEEYLVQLIEEKYGADTWSAILDRINQFYNEPEVQQLQTDCASLRAFRDGYLESMSQTFRQRLETWQGQFGDCVICKYSSCGTCNVLSEEFLSEVFTYLKAKIEYEFIQLLMGTYHILFLTNEPSWIVDYVLFWRMELLYAEMNSLGCAYECVTDKGGQVFWMDFAAYYASKMGQAMITLAINEGWVTCP